MSDVNDLTGRLEALEIRVAYQDQTIEDLALDSIATMEMVGFLEDRVEATFPDEDLAQVNSVRDLANLVQRESA